jgi:Protein of unknown function (DUF2851)
MVPEPATLYARWRAQCGLMPALREDGESPPERLLQSVWQHQRLLRDQLKTLDGRTVRILHPGFISREGGPDFRGAVIQFDDAAPIAGDVEVDLRTTGWRAHGHDRNPAFATVILHVVWDGEKALPGAPPVLPIHNRLDAPEGELNLWMAADPQPELADELLGKCSGPLADCPPERVSELLRQAAQIRFRGKAAQLQARAREAGWEQALWEGLFRALGYKHNVWPMQCLAEQRARWFPARPAPLALQARLFGISGLLPADLTRAETGADGYVRRIWDHWWREREEFADCAVPRKVWRLHGLRPANHPQRRLALAARWLAAGDLPARIERWCARDVESDRADDRLQKVLAVPSDDFWDWHWTFRSTRLAKRQSLLGGTRVTDLAVNVILPWLWIRAVEGKNETIQRALETRFESWPAADDNSVLRLARQRLFGGPARRRLKTAAEQQGVIQIVRDFCDQSNALCTHCKFPELVSEFAAQESGVRTER